jgi:two-component system, OmpR family, sensor histidine kinase VicK
MPSSSSSIKEIDEQTTIVLYDPEDIMKSALQLFSQVKERIDVCADYKAPSSHYTIKPLWNAIEGLKFRGVRTRFITEVTDKNIFYCKELIKIVDELRHLDEVKGNFGIADGIEYRASPTAEENKPPSQYVISNVKTIVEQQQYFFDMLWTKSISANQRIMEIEKGLERHFIKTIDNPIKIQKIFLDITSSASFEILIVFATFDEFVNKIKNGIVELFSKLSTSKRVMIKLLIPYPSSSNTSYGKCVFTNGNNNIKEKIEKILKQYNDQQQIHHKVQLRFLEQPLQTKVTILIVDKKHSLVIESDKEKDKTLTLEKTKEEEKEINNNTKYLQSQGLCVFSNSESTVSSLSSIFEILWRQIDLYEELRDVYKELEIRDEAQKEFIAIAAHELRNPIQPILGISEILHSKAEYSTNREHLEVIVRNARKLHKLAEDILNVTKIEKQSFRLNKELFSIKETILNAIQECKNQISRIDGNIDIIYKPLDQEFDIISINGDKGKISQVIINLIINAIQFIEKENGLITIMGERKGNQILLSVKDNGTGISPEIFPKLFSKYVSKSNMGNGLGLYISKNIIEAHDGKIWAKNNENEKGATFSFSLPISVTKK